LFVPVSSVAPSKSAVQNRKIKRSEAVFSMGCSLGTSSLKVLYSMHKKPRSLIPRNKFRDGVSLRPTKVRELKGAPLGGHQAVFEEGRTSSPEESVFRENALRIHMLKVVMLILPSAFIAA
jgi:hypothetical protein